jgi:hypothetical protein
MFILLQEMSSETRRGVCAEHLMKPSSVTVLSTLAHESSPGAEDFQILRPLAHTERNEKPQGNDRTFQCYCQQNSIPDTRDMAKSVRPWKMRWTSSQYCFKLPTSG